jgi:hypothetical protein
MKYYQQGDVILKKISELPNGLELQNHKVLQYGETTGHMHQFAQAAAVKVFHTPARNTASIDQQFKTITTDEGKFLVVEMLSDLRHEEHNPISIEPGIYQIDIVREYDYEKDEMTRVVD